MLIGLGRCGVLRKTEWKSENLSWSLQDHWISTLGISDGKGHSKLKHCESIGKKARKQKILS